MVEEGRRGTILVVDDNVAFRESTAEILELAGYEVVQAVDREDAVARLRPGNFDILLLDLGVDLGGLEVLDQAGSVPAVIVVSGVGQAEPDPRVSAFLSKPLDPRRLLSEVGRYMGGDPVA